MFGGSGKIDFQGHLEGQKAKNAKSLEFLAFFVKENTLYKLFQSQSVL